MKKWITLMLLSAFVSGMAPATKPTAGDNLTGTVTLSGAWALYPMAVKWQSEFHKLHPGVRIDISAGGAGKGLADALSGVVDLGMVSRDLTPAEVKKGAWWVPVVKDAVVPVINEKNPYLKDLRSKGVQKEIFVGIWITETVTAWGQALGTGGGKVIHVYTRSDSCGAAETWAKYLGKSQDDLAGVGVFGDPGLADAVRKDALGIGYNNVNFVYDAKTHKPIEGVTILPIDLNGNGRIDRDEDFYTRREDLLHAISAGKYPSPPARELYLVAKGKPGKPAVIAFLKWILTDGQKVAPDAGYIKISEPKLKESLKKLD